VEYVAFLRGINVSGQKLIKMEDLRKSLTEAYFSNVKTYIQSGNIIFDAIDEDSRQLILKIEHVIENTFGFHTDVILREISEIETLINSTAHFFDDSETSKKIYITFLKEEHSLPIDIPFFSKNKDVEIIYQNGKDLISVSSIYKGNYGFPNSFIEKTTGIPATTRNPNTLQKILAL